MWDSHFWLSKHSTPNFTPIHSKKSLLFQET
jgi:hypothetical protein